MYIHERADWPQFTSNWDRLSSPLSQLGLLRGRLLGQLDVLGFSTVSETMLESLTQDVVKSTEIEGERLDYNQVRSSIAHRLGIEIPTPVKAGQDVEGMVDLTLDALQHCQESLTQERLLGWHGALFPTGRSGFYRIRTAQWRDDAHGPMQVVSGKMGRERVHFQAPQASRLPAEMLRFLDWFNGDSALDPVLKAATGHLYFVTLHPFDDGNGRIARALTDMLLARADGAARRFYSMSSQIMAERAEYYRILEETQRGGMDITHWLSWFIECLARALERSQEIMGKVVHKHQFWQQHAGVAFNERHRKLLGLLLEGFEGKLTTSKWAKIAKCSTDSALRDIQLLLEHGILEREPGSGRSTNYRFAG